LHQSRRVRNEDPDSRQNYLICTRAECILRLTAASREVDHGWFAIVIIACGIILAAAIVNQPLPLNRQSSVDLNDRRPEGLGDTRLRKKGIVMIRLYYHPTPNPAKIALFLEETGLP
jgi:hypothetical protein